MFRNTKVGSSVEGLPIGDVYAGEVYLTLFDKFGPWISDSYQHILVEKTADKLEQYISNVYKSEHSRVSPEFVVVDDEETLRSNEHTYVFCYKDEFFHYILNTLVVIMYIIHKDPRAEFVVLVGNKDTNGYQWSENDRNKNLDFLERVLDLHGVSYRILDPECRPNEFEIYSARNVTVVNDFLTTRELSLREIVSLINEHLLNVFSVDVVPGRKVYISRESNVPGRSPYLVDGNPESGYETNYVRIYDEPKLEEYLKSEGFEILRSSEIDSLEDQVRLISSAELVVGATGSGMINVLFMKDAKNVIELKTEIKWVSGDHEANPHYVHFSYGKGHRYMFLDVSDKQADTAINGLKGLKRFLVD